MITSRYKKSKKPQESRTKVSKIGAPEAIRVEQISGENAIEERRRRKRRKTET